MHIAAANPQYVRRDEVPTDNLEKEREVLTQQALNEGKPAKIVGVWSRAASRSTTRKSASSTQPFVKDPDIQRDQDARRQRPTSFASCALSAARVLKRQDNLAADIAAEKAKMKK